MRKKVVKEKARAKFPEPLPRRMLVTKLVDHYVDDCEEILNDFPKEYRVELLDHMIDCLEVLAEYSRAPQKDIWKKYADLENVFLRKHRNRLQLYRQKRLSRYYWPETAVSETDVLSRDQYNSLPFDERGLSENEMENLFKRARSFLFNERDMTLLNEAPDDEAEQDLGKIPNKDPKATQSARLLAICYLLKQLGVEARNGIDISVVARFAHFLLGKNISVLSNSDIYKKLKKMPNIKSDQELIKDLAAIRPFFAEMELKDILFQIDKEIGLARKQLFKRNNS